jgi:hypothetical protein
VASNLADAAMTFKSTVLAGLLLTLGACATPFEPPVFRSGQAESSAPALSTELARVAALSPEQRRRELAGLDARTQALVELMKRSLKARIELKQQTARAQELQDKLEQIKALEKSLQQRNGPTRTP